MGVPTSEVGYTIATTRRETTEVHKNMWWHWEKEKKKVLIFFPLIPEARRPLITKTYSETSSDIHFRIKMEMFVY